MPRIRFLQDYTVKDEEAKSYAKGDECDMVDASAKHFVSRGVAVACDGEAAKPKPAARRGRPKAEESDK